MRNAMREKKEQEREEKADMEQHLLGCLDGSERPQFTSPYVSRKRRGQSSIGYALCTPHMLRDSTKHSLPLVLGGHRTFPDSVKLT